jgi:hypothetical protein
MKHKLLIVLVGLAVCLPTLVSLVNSQFFHMHDFTHVARLTELDRALKDGHFPVRWSENFGYGYGMPLFNFYAPLPYYVAEIFYIAGFGAVDAIKLLMALITWVAFGGMYAGVSKMWGRWAGIVAGTALVYVPYRAADIYVRGALGEAVAISMLAILISCLIYWYDSGSWKWVGWGALAWSGMALSHNLTALISLPFLLVFIAGLMLIGTHKKSMVGQALALFALAMGAASFYTIPAYFEKDFTIVNTLTTGFSDFRQHFLYLRQLWHSDWGYGGSIFGLEDDISFEIGKLHIILAALGFVGVWWRKRVSSKLEKTVVTLSALFVVAAMLMTSFKSQFIWEAIEFMAFIQFPWRFLAVIVVFASLMTGGMIRIFKPQSPWWPTFALATTTGLVLLNVAKFQPEVMLARTEDLYYEDPIRIQNEMSGILPDFIPGHEVPYPTVPAEKRYIWEDEQAGTVEVEIDRTHEFFLHVFTKRAQLLTINQFYFPGWRLYVEGDQVPIEVTDNGLMQIMIESSTDPQKVSGIFGETPVRRLANALSLISFIVIVYLLLPARKRTYE